MKDIEKIRAEIERRLEELNPKQGVFAGRPLRAVNPKTFPRERELEKLLSFIDSMPEKPAAEYSFNIPSELFNQLTPEQQKLWKKEIEQAYNAGMKHKEEPASDDLEIEIDKYIKENGFDGIDTIEDVNYIARYFANWQKLQIMKGAINKHVHLEYGEEKIDLFNKDLKGLKFGDKVKILIIKEG